MKNTVLSIKERAAKLAEKWYILDPLYFFIWTTHAFVPQPSIKTLRTGDGRIEYNPVFVNALTDNELEVVLKAEIMRIILKHPYARRQEHLDIMYLASNITIKEYTETPLNFPTAKSFFGTDEWDKKHFELYYHKIMEQLQNAPQSGNSCKGQNQRVRAARAAQKTINRTVQKTIIHQKTMPKTIQTKVKTMNRTTIIQTDLWTIIRNRATKIRLCGMKMSGWRTP
jgi:predicted metal-dependent peptidase